MYEFNGIFVMENVLKNGHFSSKMHVINQSRVKKLPLELAEFSEEKVEL